MHLPEPRKRSQESSYHPQHPWTVQATRPRPRPRSVRSLAPRPADINFRIAPLVSRLLCPCVFTPTADINFRITNSVLGLSHQNYARSRLHRPQLRPGAARRQWRSAGAQFRDHDGQAGAPAWSTVRHWWCHSGCSGRLGCVASRLGQHMGPAVSLCQFCSINGAYTV